MGGCVLAVSSRGWAGADSVFARAYVVLELEGLDLYVSSILGVVFDWRSI